MAVYYPNVRSVKSQFVRSGSYLSCAQQGSIARPQLSDCVAEAIGAWICHPNTCSVKNDAIGSMSCGEGAEQRAVTSPELRQGIGGEIGYPNISPIEGQFDRLPGDSKGAKR